MPKEWKIVRLTTDIYEEITNFQKMKGFNSINETIKFLFKSLKDWKKAQTERKEKIERKVRQEYVQKIHKLTEKYTLIIAEKDRIIEELKSLNDVLIHKNEEKDKEIEVLRKHNEMLESRLNSDELIRELTKAKKREEELKMKVESMRDYEIIKSENISLKEENEKLKSENQKLMEKKDIYEKATLILDDYENLRSKLSEIEAENYELRKIIDEQRKELKLIKDVIIEKLKKLLKSDYILDVRREISTFINELERKVDYELNKEVALHV